MQKIKKHYYGFISTQNKVGQAEIERKKNSSLRSIHSRPGVGISKKIAKKIEKIRKHQYGFFSSQNGTGEAENMEKKNSRSDPFQPDPE